ncbi:hypothetical protein phiAS5_ORF0230 [Aeromonas phage phiAS5]|uniref:Uncharacterized protein n=1 Tax=Aeromonas phage phiAS5 TaxID=879630 RepID=E1A1Y4_9CAUD|nr:hypothetical protein phiAS5_ORF0230 [Aeromonas phage phiAS5]ADM80073.1 hypothetical protein phiAS5_ORF0230 [Aeromonas phage phiAS5]BES53161.1 hypothetical protein [Aeromonas phage phiWae14]
MLITLKSQIKYDKPVYLVKCETRGSDITCVIRECTPIAVGKFNFTVKAAVEHHNFNVSYCEFNIGDESEVKQSEVTALNFVFTTREEAQQYANRIQSRLLHDFESRVLKVANKIHYAVRYRGMFRELPRACELIETEQRRETRVIEGKKWYCEEVDTIHHIRYIDESAKTSINSNLVKVFEDLKEAMDFCVGKF